MQADLLFKRYQELQTYVGWQPTDAARVAAAAEALRPAFARLIDDFYEEIEKHEATRRVITGGAQQIMRLKGTLIGWLENLVSGVYDRDYVARRWRVGFRHVEIGLDQVFTNAALSRLRGGLARALDQAWTGDATALAAAHRSLNLLLDLDLAIIEDAYQTAFQRRQQQVERLATIGQVAGGIAHELRNPLNVIKTSIYFLLNAKNASPDKVATHLERINRQVGLADGVITALNNFARLPVPEMQSIGTREFLRNVIDSVTIPAVVQASIDCPEDVGVIMGDARQLAIVFSNLIRNACDAMPDGGQLTIRARSLPELVEIAVTDNGVGIAPEHLSRVVEPLYSTKARGIGLGLAMAVAILDKHGGRLKIESEVGRGTTMTVLLPSTVAI
ncbi:MAG: PAS domain-containing sensor histidine kinase [Planctomycetes bacterium]|nr:PAS domain-containing sensor histidine kinase [Planctomycetota bacterium]